MVCSSIFLAFSYTYNYATAVNRMQVSPMYAAIFVGSLFFPALATIFKEKLFSASKKRLNGQSLDLFVVNSFGSAAQALFVFLLLPVMSSLKGIPLSQLPAYLKEGKSIAVLAFTLRHRPCFMQTTRRHLCADIDLSINPFLASVGILKLVTHDYHFSQLYLHALTHQT